MHSKVTNRVDRKFAYIAPPGSINRPRNIMRRAWTQVCTCVCHLLTLTSGTHVCTALLRAQDQGCTWCRFISEESVTDRPVPEEQGSFFHRLACSLRDIYTVLRALPIVKLLMSHGNARPSAAPFFQPSGPNPRSRVFRSSDC